MKKILLFCLLALCTGMMNAQRITHYFNNVTMPEALQLLNRMSNRYTINFIYNDLEDFRVTASVSNASVPDAINKLIGFYPIAVTAPTDSVLSVECMLKTSFRYKGIIVDENGHPLAFANVTLLSAADSSYLGSGVSNEGGNVVIPCNSGNVIARISFVGYTTVYKHCTNTQLGTIRMQRSNYALKEVKIKGQRPLVKARRGMLSYNMPMLLSDLPAENAYEALTHIPGVYDNNGKISFAGRQATLIINGKLTTLSDEQIVDRLKGMPAEMLATTEVMTAAPARYHVQGIAINVITKDFVGTHQLSGRLQGTLSQGKYALAQSEGNLIYSHGKLALDAQYTFTGGKTGSKIEHEAEHPLTEGTRYYYDKTCDRTHELEHEVRLGADYAFADNHRLSAAYTGTWQSNRDRNITTGTGSSEQFCQVHYYIHNFDVSYELPFGLKLDASYMKYQSPDRQTLDGYIYSNSRNLTTNSKQNISKWLFTADQTHNLKRGWQLSYGIKMQLSDNRSYQTTSDVQGNLLPDATSNVDYTERILAPYAGFSKQFGEKVSLDASLTAEQYHTPRWNKWHIYPTLNAMWNINRLNMLNLSFSTNSVFPSYWSTMSSIYYSSAYSEVWGNPELKPYSDYEVNLTWQYRQNYTFTAFAQLQPDYFTQLPYQATERMAVIMKETNFNYSNVYGLQATAAFRAGKWLAGNVMATCLYKTEKSNHFFDLPFNRSKLAGILGATASVKLLACQDLRLMINPFFQTDAIQGVYDIENIFRLDARLMWSSTDKHWSFVLQGANICNNNYTAKSVCGNQNFLIRVWQQFPTASLTAIYRMGNYKARKHKEVDTSRMGYN